MSAFLRVSSLQLGVLSALERQLRAAQSDACHGSPLPRGRVRLCDRGISSSYAGLVATAQPASESGEGANYSSSNITNKEERIAK
jgi:hypothetical protein